MEEEKKIRPVKKLGRESTLYFDINGYKFYFSLGNDDFPKGITFNPENWEPTPEWLDGLMSAIEHYSDYLSVANIISKASKFKRKNRNYNRPEQVEYLRNLISDIHENMNNVFLIANPDFFNPIVEKIHQQICSIEGTPYTPPPSPKPRPTRTGYVYLLKTSIGYWKIGFTINPKNRIVTLTYNLPFKFEYEYLIPSNDMRGLEEILHRRFADKRAEGTEFFTLTAEDVQWIKDNHEGYTPD